MPLYKGLFIAALVLNVAILAPVSSALLFGIPYDPPHLGPETDGRRVLTTMYMAIGILSAVLIKLHLSAHSWAIPMTVALFGVQIIYKALTVPLVGIDNPVIMTNIFVIFVQVITLFVYWRATSGQGKRAEPLST